ncbi:MAG: MFS transporter [Clostridia bacterium]|nr:MFS transporter [Clostridia bacterium]
MANEATALELEQEREHIVTTAMKDRRYVGTKETVAYILYDIAQSFDINKYRDIFTTDILKIGLKFQSVTNAVVGVWDIINDVLLAALVDKTRTRWGKFKPWLVIYALPGVMLSVMFWLLPLFFKDKGLYDVSKLAFFLVFQLLSNLATSLRDISRTGMLAVITPNIIDRTRLITQANLLSGFVEKGPEILMGVLIDLVNHNVLKIRMRSLYITAGSATAIVSGLFAIYFSIVAKERVQQTVEKPSVKSTFKSILNNKPLLLITLAEILGAFSVGSSLNYYYINVLGLASMSTIVGIPGAVVSPISYSWVPWARAKFSTKTLWLVGSHTSDVLMIGVFLIGAINKNYKKPAAMIPAFMLRETIWMFTWGIRSVIPEEMRNEAIDYGEWKNGYRTEGMTGVAKGIPKKIISTVGGSVNAIILDAIGYKQGAGYGEQSIETEFGLFAMSTILPVVTGALSVIPKLFYDLSGKKRDRMYAELMERRKAMSDEVNAGDAARSAPGEEA